MIEAQTRGIRRINLFGGPGCGKSVTAARLYAELCIAGFQVEHVQEYVKSWAYEGRAPASFDQVYLLGQQMRREDVLLRTVPLIITDSPILLGAVYARLYGCPAWKEILATVNRFEETYPSLNIVLDRKWITYVQGGRYQSYEQALEVDRAISDMVHENVARSQIIELPTHDFDAIQQAVEAVVV